MQYSWTSSSCTRLQRMLIQNLLPDWHCVPKPYPVYRYQYGVWYTVLIFWSSTNAGVHICYDMVQYWMRNAIIITLLSGRFCSRSAPEEMMGGQWYQRLNGQNDICFTWPGYLKWGRRVWSILNVRTCYFRLTNNIIRWNWLGSTGACSLDLVRGNAAILPSITKDGHLVA